MAFPILIAGALAGGVIWEIARTKAASSAAPIPKAVGKPAPADTTAVGPLPNAHADPTLQPQTIGTAQASPIDNASTQTMVSDGLGVALAPLETTGGKLGGVQSPMNMPNVSTAPVADTPAPAAALTGPTAAPAAPADTKPDPFGLGNSVATAYFGNAAKTTKTDQAVAIKTLGPHAGVIW
jgi:hypothetical protein